MDSDSGRSGAFDIMYSDQQVTDCCKQPSTHRSSVVEGRLYCDRECFMREAAYKWEKSREKGIFWVKPQPVLPIGGF